jgi:nucleotide-binding universal stress UspA family protein
MPGIALLCTDGSELSVTALAAGLALLDAPDRIVVATVDEGVDPMLLTGASGLSGGIVTAEQYEDDAEAKAELAADHLQATVAALGIEGRAETTVVQGEPGHALCDLAAQLPASVVVAGSHGRGGLKRALLGSVSDHLVRNAPCPVLLTRAGVDVDA